jgi:hypothetical protein
VICLIYTIFLIINHGNQNNHENRGSNNILRLNKMNQLQRIQSEITSLPKQDFTALKNWIEELDWNEWEQQIKRDSVLGKLDFLKQEAMAAKASGTLKEL